MPQDEYTENTNNKDFVGEVNGNSAAPANDNGTEEETIRMTAEEIEKYDRLIQVGLIVQTGCDCIGSV